MARHESVENRNNCKWNSVQYQKPCENISFGIFVAPFDRERITNDEQYLDKQIIIIYKRIQSILVSRNIALIMCKEDGISGYILSTL